jgi:hypothetical protein
VPILAPSLLWNGCTATEIATMMSFPDPLHPAVVHLPIALAVLMPLLAAAWIAAIAKGFLPARAWLAVVVLQVLLGASAWLAVET